VNGYLHDLAADEVALSVRNSLANVKTSELEYGIPPHVDNNLRSIWPIKLLLEGQAILARLHTHLSAVMTTEEI
jgi:hypothetical protein